MHEQNEIQRVVKDNDIFANFIISDTERYWNFNISKQFSHKLKANSGDLRTSSLCVQTIISRISV